MDTKVEDVCVIREFRLTRYQVCNGIKLVNTYFNIRDNDGCVFGPSYDDIEKPLDIMLNMYTAEESDLLSA